VSERCTDHAKKGGGAGRKRTAGEFEGLRGKKGGPGGGPERGLVFRNEKTAQTGVQGDSLTSRGGGKASEGKNSSNH